MSKKEVTIKDLYRQSYYWSIVIFVLSVIALGVEFYLIYLIWQLNQL